jgi:LEA14-like dessication related protein
VRKILDQAGISKPTVRVSNTNVTGLSFKEIDLLFDIEINNPNAVGISLTAFDYDLLLNNVSFLKGDQQQKMEIKAKDVATVQIPLTLDYKNLYDTYQNLKNADEVTYQLNTGLSFNLPILGAVRIPVSTSGEVPMLKLPPISLKSIKLKRLTLTGADFDLQVGIKNQNSWGFDINTLDYGLTINNTQWIKGQSTKKQNISAKGESVLHLPFSLSFLDLGSSVYQLVAGGKGLNYKFNGQANLSPSLEIIGDVNLPFNLSGKIDLTK